MHLFIMMMDMAEAKSHLTLNEYETDLVVVKARE